MALNKRIGTLTVFLVLEFAISAFAQDKPRFVAYPSDSSERGTSRVLYWDGMKNRGAGQVAIDYGRPAWKKAYENEGLFDSMTKGKTWRLGSNFWTELNNDMPLTIVGRPVAAGQWFLGVHRSDDGSKWSLVFIDPAKIRSSNIDASEIGRAPVEFEVPLTMEKQGEIKDKLTIDLVYQNPNNLDVILKISWGNFSLNAPVKVPERS
ncbi:MAG: DUF2911 domain-containing protein [Blastocatellia bacterium]